MPKTSSRAKVRDTVRRKDLQKTEDDTKNKVAPSKKLSVKEKREEKRAQFLEKLHSTKKKIKVDKDAKKVGFALASVGNLSEALKQLDEANDTSSNQSSAANVKNKTVAKKSGKISNKKKKKIQMEEIKLFQQVFAHPAMKENPFAAIKEHLKNTFVNQEKPAEE